MEFYKCEYPLTETENGVGLNKCNYIRKNQQEKPEWKNQ